MANEFKIFSWNVAGLRAIWKKSEFQDWFKNTSPDILCLQEIKVDNQQLDETLTKVDGYTCNFFSAERKGYSGVAIYSKQEPLSVRKGFGNPYFDVEGRVIEAEYKDFVLYNVYFPNGGKGPDRVRYKLDFYDEVFFQAEKKRKKQKNVIVCGDYNTAHKEIDLAQPEKFETKSGFLPEERHWIDVIINLGYVDVFREYHKEPGIYTFWDNYTRAREKNLGWRIDYFFISKEMLQNVTQASIHPDVMGSDHCPIELSLRF